MALIILRKKQCVEHYTDGRISSSIGLVGTLIRIRGILFTIALTIVTMGVPFWWPDSNNNVFNKIYSIKLGHAILLYSVIIGVLAIAGLIYLRKRTIRSLDIKYKLHELAHYLRDKQAGTYEKYKRIINHVDIKTENLGFCEFANSICELIKSYFCVLTKDSTVAVSIRLAIKVQSEGINKYVYKTIGRSSGLNKERSKTSEDIAANEGIPRFLYEEKNSVGVLLYNDINEAAKIGAFKLTKNEILYPHEIKTMMVAPINGWDGNEKNLIGILFVSSRKDGIFSQKYVDSILFIADLIAQTISFIVVRKREIQYRESQKEVIA